MDKKLTLNKIGIDTHFKRKPDAKTTYIRGYYYRAGAFGPAAYGCNDSEDMNREIFLSPLTSVYVDA